MNVQNKIILWVIIVSVLVAGGGIGCGIWYNRKYTDLRNTVEAASAGELQRKLDTALDSLDRTTADLTESRQSVAELEGIDRQRNEGVERIERSLIETGDAIRDAKSGNAMAEAAFRGIEKISYILETEFGGRSK